MADQTITKTFETASGKTVTVVGKFIEQEEYTYPSLDLTELQDVYKTTLEVIVEGIGSQGGNISPTRFSKDGVDYTHKVGKLALTAEQVAIITSVKDAIENIKNNHPVIVAQRKQNELDRAEFGDGGTYEDVERLHPWMKNTY